MRTISKLVGLAGLLALSPVSAQGPAPVQPAAKEAAPVLPTPAPTAPGAIALTQTDVNAWLDGFMPYALARGDIAGAVVVVVKDGQVLFEKGYGYSDVAKRTPVKPDGTLFRPGSVSKLFTWTAVMQLVEQGKLDLDADVNTYLDFKIPPYQGKPVTLRNIMTHSAGFEESVRYLIGSDAKTMMPLGEMLAKSVPARVFAPGTTPAYSNYATAVAGHIVARVSGMSFDDYIDRNIFARLGMAHSSFRQPLPAALQPMMSQGYPQASKDAKAYEIVYPAPAGSLASTGSDMAKFMIAHLNNGGPLLKPETAAMMHNYKAYTVGPLNRMALGFYELNVNGHRAIAHGGDTQWFHSYLWLFPDSNIGMFVSVNSPGAQGAAGALRSALFHGFADRYLPGPKPSGSVDAATAKQHAQMMAGNYINSRGAFTNFLSILGLLSQMTVSVDGKGELSVPAITGLGQQPQKWTEISPFVWTESATGERLAAEVKDGKVTRISTDPFSPFMVFDRVPGSYNAAWLLPAFFAALGVAALTALAWPIVAITRWRYSSAMPLAGRQKLAYRVSRGFAWLATLTMGGWLFFVTKIMGDLDLTGGALDPALYLLQILSPIAFFGLVAAACWYGWLVWTGKRKWGAKGWSIILVAASLILLYVALSYHLIGFGTLY